MRVRAAFVPRLLLLIIIIIVIIIIIIILLIQLSIRTTYSSAHRRLGGPRAGRRGGRRSECRAPALRSRHRLDYTILD